MSTGDQLCEVIVTAPDRDWLIDLCRQLVDAQLAASAHVMHPITSIYRWEGAVHETTEARAFLRSRRELLDELTEFIVARHPYRVPNVTALPIVGGNPEYLAWGSRGDQRPPHPTRSGTIAKTAIPSGLAGAPDRSRERRAVDA